MNTDEYHGKRNLILLGVGALLLTALTTTMSLWLYRTSGDIFLDRSRPGYLPDKEEAGQDSEISGTYSFSDTGTLNSAELTEYLKQLKIIIDRIKALDEPYAPGALSDESLGIFAKPEAETSEAKKPETKK